ncbi:hypothetical protein [Bacillus pumilus]|nr:hypothetical protein [Bacillus pumilus]MBC3643659.1 hypothetical protein [Bacillus pumilus]MBC3645885.1 hypothetical protein [Bacillus pumilus]MBC3649917.1 hypothetical protein [Bacillus pumilus]MBC3653882.1 hypothetical protein [Bacillus pumilus]MBC3657219.1 hypothetical protein [Bacillus pumilus]
MKLKITLFLSAVVLLATLNHTLQLNNTNQAADPAIGMSIKNPKYY